MKWNDLISKQNARVGKSLERYKWVLLVIVVGLVLLALPSGAPTQLSQEHSRNQGPSAFDLAALEEKFSKALSEISGAGEVTVVLSVKTGTQQILAEDSEYAEKDQEVEESTKTVVLSKGSGVQEAVTLQEIYPQFQGAVIICSGGDNPTVRLKLTEACSALTGLGADKISICSRGK
jgi:stage III sporulation protein AG